jgi:hypothetical protein
MFGSGYQEKSACDHVGQYMPVENRECTTGEQETANLDRARASVQCAHFSKQPFPLSVFYVAIYQVRPVCWKT